MNKREFWAHLNGSPYATKEYRHASIRQAIIDWAEASGHTITSGIRPA